MTWKFLIGKMFSELDQLLLRSGLNFVNKNYPFGRHWTFDVKRILQKDPELIIDAGANVGSLSKELNYWFPKAEIFAFEPINDTFNLLTENTKKLTKIQPIKFALGAVNENIMISLSGENTINSLKIAVADNPIGTEEISITRLDDFLIKYNLKHVDILKIDVEGYEFEVLKGCGSLDISCILLEVGYEREPTKVYFSDIDVYMENQGYQLCGIYEIMMRRFHNKKRITYSNNLYIKKSLLE